MNELSLHLSTSKRIKGKINGGMYVYIHIILNKIYI